MDTKRYFPVNIGSGSGSRGNPYRSDPVRWAVADHLQANSVITAAFGSYEGALSHAAELEAKLIEHCDGESGRHLLTMPEECAVDCSVPGQPADESVAFWRNRVEWVADEPTLRHSLRGYGAWDDLDTADLDTIKNRVLWLAACDWRENRHTDGQDRESYSDTQDRANYRTDGDESGDEGE